MNFPLGTIVVLKYEDEANADLSGVGPFVARVIGNFGPHDSGEQKAQPLTRHPKLNEPYVVFDTDDVVFAWVPTKPVE